MTPGRPLGLALLAVFGCAMSFGVAGQAQGQAPDTTPDAFSFADQRFVSMLASRSETITVSGIDSPAPISTWAFYADDPERPYSDYTVYVDGNPIEAYIEGTYVPKTGATVSNGAEVYIVSTNPPRTTPWNPPAEEARRIWVRIGDVTGSFLLTPTQMTEARIAGPKTYFLHETTTLTLDGSGSLGAGGEANVEGLQYGWTLAMPLGNTEEWVILDTAGTAMASFDIDPATLLDEDGDGAPDRQTQRMSIALKVSDPRVTTYDPLSQRYYPLGGALGTWTSFSSTGPTGRRWRWPAGTSSCRTNGPGLTTWATITKSLPRSW